MSGGAAPAAEAVAATAPVAEAAAAAETVAVAPQAAAQVESSSDAAGGLAKLEEVKTEMIEEGSGKLCKDADIATMQYTGVLYNNQAV